MKACASLSGHFRCETLLHSVFPFTLLLQSVAPDPNNVDYRRIGFFSFFFFFFFETALLLPTILGSLVVFFFPSPNEPFPLWNRLEPRMSLRLEVYQLFGPQYL